MSDDLNACMNFPTEQADILRANVAKMPVRTMRDSDAKLTPDMGVTNAALLKLDTDARRKRRIENAWAWFWLAMYGIAAAEVGYCLHFAF